ncbi:MAG: endolytic transglycosylase MltG, partial [Oscillospiraceae bacterium]|nr:endolytic transglycosylase MltG [Oscillospiraceae bacterium]
LGMTLDEVVRLASIVQWEGNDEDNWAKISSVFHNRLNDPDTFPKLESDATETYIAMCITPKITSSNKDKMQAITEAYDTYNCTGLPAGAICNPGLDTINAVLYPAETSYYYFLANKDGDFYYAKTLEQHEQNIIDAGLQPPEQTDEGETY